MNYSNQFYKSARYSLNRKRQIIDAIVNNLHNTQMEMIEDAVLARESAGFPEANEIINYIKAL
jgi:hypothetical protein